MDFFERQDATRRHSRYLVGLFLLAVVAITVAVTFLVLVVAGRPATPDIGLFSPLNLHRQTPLMITTAVAALLLMGLSSLFRSVSLREGGGKVARELGAQRLDGDTNNPQLRQLQDVVEEIALAAGVPVPEIYVLEGEDGINAFAAGYSPADAAITVTRGALDKLDRDELQGVIAHEFSHVLNGDMRLNIRLIGVVFGILVLAIVGQRVLFGGMLFGGGRRRDNNNSGAAIMAIGLGLVAIGFIGLFFGRWIKAAVSRSRESLADASAVQFTRYPQGLSGALKKIAVYEEGSLLNTDSEEVNHMLFGEAKAASMFATHPPLLQRIRAIEPSFRESDLQELVERLQRQDEGIQTTKDESKRTSGEPRAFNVDALLGRIGSVDGAGLAAAATLAGTLPAALREAARNGDHAPELVLFLLLDADESIRTHQFADIRQQLGTDVEQRVRSFVAEHATVAPEQRLALLDTALPSLKRRSPQYLQQFESLAESLSEADHHISAFEFLLAQVLRSYLRDAATPTRNGGRARLQDKREAALTTLNAMAHFGNPDNPHAANAALAVGCRSLGMDNPPAADWARSTEWLAHLRGALSELDTLAPQDKKKLVNAWMITVLQDSETVLAEREMLRAFCLTIHVPVPRQD